MIRQVLVVPVAMLMALPGVVVADSFTLEGLLSPDRDSVAGIDIDQKFDVNPFSAVELNNLAVDTARDGDVYTALALLERAIRLAPDHVVIVDNRDLLRGWLSRRVQDLESRPAADAEALVALPEPPALWRGR